VATDAKQKLNPSQLPLPTAGGQYSTTFKLLVVGRVRARARVRVKG